MSAVRPSWSAAARRALVGFVAAALVATGAVGTAQPSHAAGDSLTFYGHGYGHGRGMGQYGALGYAVDHGWQWTQILGHFYGGTTLRGDAGNPTISVELSRANGIETIVSGTALTINGAFFGNGAIRFGRGAGGALQLFTGPGCNGPWNPIAEYPPGAVIGTTAPESPSTLLNLCEPGTDHGYRGTIVAAMVGGTQYTLNVLPAESYLRGVVPRESPASWGSSGGGRGMQALMAQAVAARSYAQAPRSGLRASGAQTCDTESCQVYLGATQLTNEGTRSSLEHPLTDQAVASTAGHVMRTGAGKIALTEFSSSTGGYTAGGAFPAVVDEGDDVASNANHSWVVSLPLADIASRLGTGPIRSIAVTGRNGLGAEGGRVTSLSVTTTGGQTSSFTGSRVRIALGLKSDWFSISGYTYGEAQAVVRALYQDLLGRAPDDAGLTGWADALVRGTSQTALVDALTRSDEYVNQRVAKAYREVLGREPEAAGIRAWHDEIMAKRLTVDDVQRRFYDSDEFFARSGGTPEGYVDMLYRTMFQRPATAQEAAAWSEQIRQVGRSRVVDGIWFSFEAAMYRAGNYYRTFLKREPDVGGQQAWAQVLLVQGEGAVRIGIAGSDEYRSLAQVRFP